MPQDSHLYDLSNKGESDCMVLFDECDTVHGEKHMLGQKLPRAQSHFHLVMDEIFLNGIQGRR